LSCSDTPPVLIQRPPPHALFLCTPPPPTALYTLSLHDALPISVANPTAITRPALAISIGVRRRTAAWIPSSSRRSLSCAIASTRDRKSTRLNSSHVSISYAVFCLKKKTRKKHISTHLAEEPHMS